MTETSITSSTVTIEWMLTDPYNPSRQETFRIIYGDDPNNLDMSTPVVTAIPTSQTYSTQLNSLQPATVYFYRLEAMNMFEAISTDLMFFLTSTESSKLCGNIKMILQKSGLHAGIHLGISSWGGSSRITWPYGHGEGRVDFIIITRASRSTCTPRKH